MKILVSINGADPIEAEQVRVFVEELPTVNADGDEIENGQIQYNFTHEGVIQDLIDGDGISCGTDSVTYEERAVQLYLYG